MASFPLEPTVIPAHDFVPANDAKLLRAAMKGFGTNEGKVIQVLTKRTNLQRQQILASYGHELGRDLIKDLKSELGGKFETLILALLDTPATFLAKELHEVAFSGLGTNENVLTSIICTQSNQDLQNIRTAYHQKYDKPLEGALKSEVSGDYEKLLLLLLSNSRDERTVDHGQANQMANRLYRAGVKKLGTDEQTFIDILTHSSFGQIKLISDEYRKLSGKTLVQDVKSEFSGDLEDALVTIIKFAENHCAYYAEKVEEAIKGFGTNDRALVRIILSRSEIDLGGVKREYQNLYKKSLDKAIDSETSGDYKAALLSLIGHI